MLISHRIISRVHPVFCQQIFILCDDFVKKVISLNIRPQGTFNLNVPNFPTRRELAETRRIVYRPNIDYN